MPANPMGPPVFGPDGVYFVSYTADTATPTRKVEALDGGGRARPGWPFQIRREVSSAELVAASDGSVYLLECSETGADVTPDTGCAVHRLDEGRELPGWPFEMDAPNDCRGLRVAPDGGAYVTCGFLDIGVKQVFAIDSEARIRPGWPLALQGEFILGPASLSPNGTLVAVTGTDDATLITAIGTDGNVSPGWPVSVPRSVGFERHYIKGPNGTIYLWWSTGTEEEQTDCIGDTEFVALGPDGQVLPTWPRLVQDEISQPVLSPSGSLYFATGRGDLHVFEGQQQRSWSHVAREGSNCRVGLADLYMSPDGTIYLLSDYRGSDGVVALGPGADVLSGWPYDPAGELAWVNAVSWNEELRKPPIPPAFGADGTVYIASYLLPGFEIVALDPSGRVRAGWPYRFAATPPEAGAQYRIESLTMSPDGQLYVLLRQDCCGGGTSLFALGTDGLVPT